MDLHPMLESRNISSRLMLQRPRQDAGLIYRWGGREGADDFYMIPRLGSVGNILTILPSLAVQLHSPFHSSPVRLCWRQLIPVVPHEKHMFLKILGPTPSPFPRKIMSGPQALSERGTWIGDRLLKL